MFAFVTCSSIISSVYSVVLLFIIIFVDPDHSCQRPINAWMTFRPTNGQSSEFLFIARVKFYLFIAILLFFFFYFFLVIIIANHQFSFIQKIHADKKATGYYDTET